MMVHWQGPIADLRQVAENIFVLGFEAPPIAQEARPGQFINIKVRAGNDPLLRRPFSVYRTAGERVEILFNVVGKGTELLSLSRSGDPIDVIGPLGVPFTVRADDYDTAILVGGGLGVAPLPLLGRKAQAAGKEVLTLIGARTASQLVTAHLDNLRIATDDGSRGYQGTVVDLLASTLRMGGPSRARVFGCGPTPMLRALAELCVAEGLACEVSLEGPMACGMGICQGCPVELVGETKGYALICKDGPTFDVRRIRI
jgi:dihydroorotate dehydrogenase electron transfer subunit